MDLTEYLNAVRTSLCYWWGVSLVNDLGISKLDSEDDKGIAQVSSNLPNEVAAGGLLPSPPFWVLTSERR